MRVKTETLIRTIILFIALLNQVLVITGHSVLPFSDAEIEQGVSMLVTVIASVWAWWKNNSFTKDHIEADAMVEQKRAMRKLMRSIGGDGNGRDGNSDNVQ